MATSSHSPDQSYLIIPADWRIALCQPQEPAGPGCQPTVLSQDVRQHSAYVRTEYRGACFGCGWLGSIRPNENEATEDSHDHTHPGWRDLPVFDPLPYTEPRNEERRRDQIARECAHLFPDGWAERRGPTITWRTPPCTRHVPGGGIFGGYNIGRTRPGAAIWPLADARVEKPQSPQLDLFDQQ